MATGRVERVLANTVAVDARDMEIHLSVRDMLVSAARAEKASMTSN